MSMTIPDGMEPMLAEHLDEVMVVERQAYAFPWSKGNFQDCLKSSYQCWVYRQDGWIIGYAVLSFAAGEAHVLNLCVRPDRQGQGVGRRLLAFLLSLVHDLPVTEVFLEVRDSNQAARMLYESAGFNQYAERKNYYPGKQGREHAALYCKAIVR